MATANSIDRCRAEALLIRAKRRILGREVAALRATGFVGPDDIRTIAALLAAGRSRRLIDMGCGNGRLGRTVASLARCQDYHGFDRDPLGIASAEASRIHWPRLRQAFNIVSFDRVPEMVPMRGDALLAHDSLYLAPDLDAALGAARALLSPGARLIATAYVGETEEGGVRARTDRDWQKALDSAGFEQIRVSDISGEWRHWAGLVHMERLRLLDRVRYITAEMDGIAAISRRMLGLDGRAAFLDTARRIRIEALVPDRSSR